MKSYSTIKELTANLEEITGQKVIDGWKEGKYWVSQIDGEFLGIEDKETGKWLSFQKGGFRIKCLSP